MPSNFSPRGFPCSNIVLPVARSPLSLVTAGSGIRDRLVVAIGSFSESCPPLLSDTGTSSRGLTLLRCRLRLGAGQKIGRFRIAARIPMGWNVLEKPHPNWSRLDRRASRMRFLYGRQEGL